MDKEKRDQFNRMHRVLKVIAESYISLSEIDEEAELTGVSREEYLEMAYENMKFDAERAIEGGCSFCG